MQRFKTSFFFVIFTVVCLNPGPAIAAEPVSQATTVDQLKELFASQTKVKIRTVGPVIVLDGEVDETEQIMRIDGVVTSLRDASVQIKSLVRINPETLKNLALQIIKEIGLPGVGVRFINSELILEGIVDNDFQADRTIALVHAMLSSDLGSPSNRFVSSTVVPQKSQVGQRTIPGLTILDFLRVRPRGKR